jgi:hypothetical protein
MHTYLWDVNMKAWVLGELAATVCCGNSGRRGSAPTLQSAAASVAIPDVCDGEKSAAGRQPLRK